MSLKTQLMSSVAALTLMGGVAFAEEHTAAGTLTVTDGQTQSQQEFAAGWNEDLDRAYADIADRQIAELIGMDVISENGDDVGEVDNFVLIEGELRAVVGVGGFLGLGEHEVALPLSEMTYNGEALVISYTKEQLEEMPEYTEELEAQRLAETDTFRTRSMAETETARVEGATGGMNNNADVSGAGQPAEGEQLSDGSATIETDTTAGQEATADSSIAVETDANAGQEATADAGGVVIDEPAGEAEAEMTADVEGEGESDPNVLADNGGQGGETENNPDNVEVAEGDAPAGSPDAANPDQMQTAEADTMRVVEEGGEQQPEETASLTDAVNDSEAPETDGEYQTAESDGDTTGNMEAGADANAEMAATQLEEDPAQADGEYAVGWNEDLDQRYGEIADRQIAELIGMHVVSQDGEKVGEVDNFVLMEDELRAVVGVGGFLGLGEHEVALPLTELTYEGDQLVISYSKEDLEAMPEYTEEIEAQRLAETDTFRARGSAEGEMRTAEVDPGTPEEASPSGEEVAAAEEAAGDRDTVTEEVAENEQGEIEQEAEELTAEAGNALQEGADALQNAGDDAAQVAENAGEAIEGAAAEAGQEVADAAQATENAVEGAAAETERMAENVGDKAGTWMEKLEGEFAEIAEWEITELEGKKVATANGEEIGEIDDLARQSGSIVAVIGIGGFLGLGEHDVALDLSELTWDGEKFVVDGMTEEELKGMAEVDESTLEMLDDTTTLRAESNM